MGVLFLKRTPLIFQRPFDSAGLGFLFTSSVRHVGYWILETQNSHFGSQKSWAFLCRVSHPRGSPPQPHPLPSHPTPPSASLEQNETHSWAWQEVFGPSRPAPFNIKAPLRAKRTLKRYEKLGLPYRASSPLSEAGQEGILRCHPDLAGREQQQGTLTAESQREQSSAGLTSLGAEDRQRLAELNAQYRARFGFPFVLAARLSDRAAVLRELARRLRCPPAHELRTALGEVKKIGHLRLADLLLSDPARL